MFVFLCASAYLCTCLGLFMHAISSGTKTRVVYSLCMCLCLYVQVRMEFNFVHRKGYSSAVQWRLPSVTDNCRIIGAINKGRHSSEIPEQKKRLTHNVLQQNVLILPTGPSLGKQTCSTKEAQLEKNVLISDLLSLPQQKSVNCFIKIQS